MKTTIFIIRSAESEANMNNILGESNNYELTELGKKSVEKLISYFADKRISKIYSSKSTMCIKTVEKIAENLNLEINCDDRLKEKYFGIYDGKCWDEIVRNDASIKKFRKKKIEILGIPNQESTKQVGDRMSEVVREIAHDNLGQNVLIVSHGVAIETFLRLIVGIPYSEDKDKYFQKNSAINEIVYDEDIDQFEVKIVAELLV